MTTTTTTMTMMKDDLLLTTMTTLLMHDPSWISTGLYRISIPWKTVTDALTGTEKRELTTKQAAFVLRHKRDAVMILFCFVSSTLIESGTSAMQHLPSILLTTLHQRWIDLPIHEELWENDMNTMSIRV